MTAKSDRRLDRRDVVKRILNGRDDILVITGLSGAAYDSVAARGPGLPLTFNMHGALGGAAMMGLGLAFAQPDRRVVVLLGDGDMLMGLGSLATVAAARPTNLAVVCLDNEIYGETGNQETATRFGVDLAGVARAAGFPIAVTLTEEAGVGDALAKVRGADGPVFVNVKVSAEGAEPLAKTRDGVWMKMNFRTGLLGTP